MRKKALLAAVAMAFHGAAESRAGTLEPCDLGKLIAPVPGGGDEFGRRVAISGGTIAIGSWQDDTPVINAGSVVIYRYVRGEWVVEAELSAPTPLSGDRFGAAVALEGDVLVVGAPEDDEAASNAGIAFVYRRTEGVWALEATLKNQNPAANDQFGSAVAISGGTIAVTARLDDEPATNTGSVVIFTQSEPPLWVMQAKFKGNDSAASDQFGVSVALDGNTLLVGAFNDDDVAIDAGTAFIFARSGDVWTQQVKLAPGDLGSTDFFGNTVDVDGDYAVVGSPQDDDGASNAGSAYAYLKLGGVWTFHSKITPSSPDADERFGQSVAVQDGRLLVGAPGDDTRAMQAGSVRQFIFTGSGWLLDGAFTAFDQSTGAGLGASVDLDAGLIVAGADKALAGGAGTAGAAYVFPATAEDCNGNGTVDWCDVVVAGVEDCNSNGIPDPCEVIPPLGDLDLDCFVNGSDLGILLGEWDTTNSVADLNGDGIVDGADLGLLLANWT